MKVISVLLPESWGYFCMKNFISTTLNCPSHIHESTHFILFALHKVHPRFFSRLACGPPKRMEPGAPPRWHLPPLSGSADITCFRYIVLEIGRYLKIPRDQRLCSICNVLEDEFHFVFECKRNTNNLNIFCQYIQNIYSNFLELNQVEKITKILNPSTPEQIRTVTSFIRQSLELREGDSSQS
jgi:hypothetical protein